MSRSFSMYVKFVYQVSSQAEWIWTLSNRTNHTHKMKIKCLHPGQVKSILSQVLLGLRSELWAYKNYVCNTVLLISRYGALGKPNPYFCRMAGTMVSALGLDLFVHLWPYLLIMQELPSACYGMGILFRKLIHCSWPDCCTNQGRLLYVSVGVLLLWYLWKDTIVTLIKKSI